MLSDTDIDDHYNPSLRLLEIEKSEPNWGFRLTRSRWDPYPWVSAVDAGSAAETAGVQTGDCLLEVNGADVVGRRVSEVAEMVRSRFGLVSLLLWNAGVDPQCNHEVRKLCFIGELPNRCVLVCYLNVLTVDRFLIDRLRNKYRNNYLENKPHSGVNMVLWGKVYKVGRLI